MALTNSNTGGYQPTAGATRQERLRGEAAAAGPGSATPAQGPAFIDDSTPAFSRGATELDHALRQGFGDGNDATPLPQAGNISLDDSDERYDYYPDPGEPSTASTSAPIVNRQATVQGGQAGTQPAPHSGGGGFPGLP